jgi:hypothetical protein
MTPRSVRWAVFAGRVGIAGRGLVLLGLGALLAHGAYGDGGAAAHSIIARLARIAGTPLGAFVIVGAGLCLIAYGVHMVVWSRYLMFRRAPPDDPVLPQGVSPQAR